MGSGSGSPFPSARREHAPNPAQRNRRSGQGEPPRNEDTSGLRPAPRDDAQLGTRQGRGHAGRPPSVQHGPRAVGAEQAAAARGDQQRARTATATDVSGGIRAAFREWRARWGRWGRRPSAKQDRDARARSRGVRFHHYPEATRGAWDRAPTVEGTARFGRRHCAYVGLVPRAERWLCTGHVDIEKSTGGRSQGETCAEGKLPTATERRLAGSATGAVWRLRPRRVEGRG